MDRRLQKLQNRIQGLNELVSQPLPRDEEHISSCEKLVRELRSEHQGIASDLADATTLAMRKLAKDFSKFAPVSLQVLSTAERACLDARAGLRKAQADQQGPSMDLQSEPAPSALELQLQQLQLEKEEDSGFKQAVEQELRGIESRATTVRSLTENVAMLVHHQGEDASQVQDYSSQARDDAVAGLGELAEVKKREAGKHTTRGTTVSAVIGGAMGLVGGPIGVAFGAAAGAAVGAAVGSSIAGLSRRSIDREVRAFKNKFRVQIRPDGSCFAHAQVFENERWSFTGKIWSSDNLLSTDRRSKWSLDERGTPLGPDDPSPVNPTAQPLIPALHDASKGNSQPFESNQPVLVQKRSAYSELEGEDPFTQSQAADSTFAGKWHWPTHSMWMPDMSDRNADTGGWKYAFSFAEGAVWTSAPTRSSFVRQRCWIRDQVLDAKDAFHPERIALIHMENKRADADIRVRHAQMMTKMTPDVINQNATDSARRSVKETQQSVETNRVVYEHLRAQGKQLDDAAVDVAIVEDASAHAQRVSRAVTMGGVLRNAFSLNPSSTEQAKAHRERPHHVQDPAFNEHHTQVGWDHPVDHLERLTDQQLHMSTAIQHEVEDQNQRLDRLAEASERGKTKILRAKDMI